MQTRYANQWVLLLRTDVLDSMSSDRYRRWWIAANWPTSATYPMVMVDSGQANRDGSAATTVDGFRGLYESMIDTAILRPALADLYAVTTRMGDRVRVSVMLVNRSGVTLGAANDATVIAQLYEDKNGRQNVRNSSSRSIYTFTGADLPNGATGVYELEVDAPASFDWNAMRVVVIADYRPNRDQAYDTLQATIAVPASRLNGVRLEGPVSALTDADISFTAAAEPGNATVPLTYTWTIDNPPQVITRVSSWQDTIQLRWPSAGTAQVRVQVSNADGSYTASKTVQLVDTKARVYLTHVLR